MAIVCTFRVKIKIGKKWGGLQNKEFSMKPKNVVQ